MAALDDYFRVISYKQHQESIESYNYNENERDIVTFGFDKKDEIAHATS